MPHTAGWRATVTYDRDFFRLQLAFADGAAALSGLPLPRCSPTPFLERLEGQESLEGLDQCFPLQALAVEAPADEFYALFRV